MTMDRGFIVVHMDLVAWLKVISSNDILSFRVFLGMCTCQSVDDEHVQQNKPDT